ncbi:MAG: BPL-N domain-containing protein [Methanobacterium sp.]
MIKSLKLNKKSKVRSKRFNQRSSKQYGLLYRFKIFLPLSVLLVISIMIMGTYAHTSVHNGTNDKVIKVLIYDGPEADSNCTLQTEIILNNANENKSSNIKFEYNTTNVITADTLADYNVLYMPGGQGGEQYVDSENINSDAIENFVASGNGFVGICAGAYAGANYTDGLDYNGWGIAPDVNTEADYTEENLSIQTTNIGQQVLGDSRYLTMSHENGPAFYGNESNYITFATYADDSSGFQGYGAIVGDYYGNGRVALSGVHPELNPQHPEILTNLIIWAANA